MDENKITVSFAINMKKDRIRIHRTTLVKLGQPKFLQLLVNPTEKIVAIRGLDKRDKDTHIVNYSFFKTDASFEIYSKQLVSTLMSLLPKLEKDCTYRLTGEVRPNEKIAFFSLDTMMRVEGGN